MIVITSIVRPEFGWPMAVYCPICRVTVIVLNPWAAEPEEGGWWRIQGCEYHSHSMIMALGDKKSWKGEFRQWP